jgi:tyrosinase
MTELNDVQVRVNRLFANLPDQTPSTAFRTVTGETVEPTSAKPLFFSEFIDEHREEAISLAEDFMKIADATPGTEGLDAVVNQARIEKEKRPLGLVHHALMLFILHHPQGRKLRIPSLLTRSPSQVFASSALSLEAAEPSSPGPIYARSLRSGSSPPEHRLDWFREDPLANEHHEHWHVVYPIGGIPGTEPRRLKDRHGELFLYMHEQMLARYDAERIAVGLDLVVPFSDYREPIPEGYDPGGLSTPDDRGRGTFRNYASRTAGTVLRDLTPDDFRVINNDALAWSSYSLHQHEILRDRTLDAVDSGYYRNGNEFVEVPQDYRGSDIIGKTNEPTIASVSRPFYGSHHGSGHILIAFAISNSPGVMVNTATAIRDPIFWRWHRHIDDIGFRHQQRLSPNNYSDRPPVSMRKNGTESIDLILCRLKDVSAIGDLAKEGTAIGQHAFGKAGGNNNWETDFTSGISSFTYNGAQYQLSTVAELTTEMKLGKFTLTNNQSVGFPYLSHFPYCYFIRLKNDSSEDKNVTVRLFLAPTTVVNANPGQIDDPSTDEYINNRRLWIEMDKFQYNLKADEEAVVFRQDNESSIIRRPIVDPGEVLDLDPGGDSDGDGKPDDAYCECGWPYHLLLPRGTASGMYFRLFAIVTDGALDVVPSSEQCGSMSFCGVREEYPDKRPMGYPFDRRFPRNPDNSTMNFQLMFAELPNSSSRRVLIRCVNL